MSKQPFYLTTPLYYVNAKPHLGHAYTTIVADCLARAHRQRGEQVFLLTGTDEHGEKVAESAAAKGVSPQAFVDETSQTFRDLWVLLGINYDYFIRTTDDAHKATVQLFLERLKESDAIATGTYTFWYCVPCETSWAEGDLEDLDNPVCGSCKRPVEQVTEDNYFLDLEQHREWLKDYIESTPGFVTPESRKNEVLAMLKKPLPALCLTRPKERVSWGVEVPFSPEHVTYVWFDALLNYISALGWPEDDAFETYWNQAGAMHLVGKDIIRHHALYWPIILHALGIEPPKKIFAHGWWMVKGEKMSKSLGNIVDPQSVIEAYGLDAFRYFLLRDVPFGDDGVFSEESYVGRINADLANDLGNLVYRSLSMLEKRAGGVVPQGCVESRTSEWIQEARESVWQHLQDIQPNEALKALWTLIGRANKSIEEAQPWTLAKEGKTEELNQFLYQLVEIIRVVAVLAWPFMPTTAESIWRQLGMSSELPSVEVDEELKVPVVVGQTLHKEDPLFPRIELETQEA